MDDVNINEICLHVEEVEVIADGDEWIKLNWINKRSSDNETCQLLDERKEDSNNEIAQTNDNDNKVLCRNTESEDISDGISVITESDTDTVNTNIFQICQSNNTNKPLRMLETQITKQANINLNVFMACVIGIIIGIILSYSSFIVPKIYPNSNEIHTESLKTVSHNIVNTCKALTEVKTMLNEIKAHTAVDKKIMEHFIGQFFKIDSANKKMDNKPTITLKSFNFDPYSLDQMAQIKVFLHILSSLVFNNYNSSLKNEISKTLDIVNNTKVFYENLLLFNNNTQNEYNSLALKILQHNSDKIHVTSKLLLSNLIEKISKITLSIYNKYNKEKHKLIKKLCNLKSVLPNDEFLKRLTENNQLFKNYDKSCFSNYSSQKLNIKAYEKRNAKIKNITELVKEADDTVVSAKYDKECSKKMYSDRKSSSKNERIKRLNKHNYTIKKFFLNVSDKIYNTSQLLPSDLIEKINKEILNKYICTTYNKTKFEWIKDKHRKDINKFLEQSTEDDEENNRKSVNFIKESIYLQLIGIQKDDMLKDNFDNILIQSWKDCPLLTNYCPRFNIDVPSLLPTSTCKTEDCIVNNKYDANSKKSVLDYGSSPKVLFEKNRSKQKNYSQSKSSIKKVFNNDHKNIKKKKKIFPQNEIKNHISKYTVNYYKSKRSLFNNYVTKNPDKKYNQDYINIDWQRDNERFYMRKKQHGASDWYFQRVHSRRKARRHAEDIYQRNTKRFWNKYQI
ncbi:uncharacterized protein [Anoplolepis gracilipes]|uniref:uncharacterized protein n=1 Tax=Anoplolepis gracilipes TaxID=354296 RepID=UPI003B9F5504